MGSGNIVSKLRNIWEAGTQELSTAQSAKDEVFTFLLGVYQEPSRVYHNLTHLYHIFQHLDQAGVRNEICFWSVWFHDCVQNQFSSTNEEKSAQVATHHLTKLGVSGEVISEVCFLIEATKLHESTSNLEYDSFLDADMAILGAAQSTYEQYVESVYKEYWLFPKALIKNGRHRFLRKLLSLERIYHTEYFYDRFEIQARLNIETELGKN